MKLTYKISLVILAVSLVGTAVVGYVLSEKAKTAERTHIAKGQSQIAEGVMNKIDRVLYERYQDISAMAEDEFLESLFEAGEIDLVDGKKMITELTLLTGPWDALDIVDTTGTIVVASDVEGGDVTEHSDEKKAFKAAMSGKVYYSDVVIGDHEIPTVIFAAPIRSESDPKRPVIGVIMGNYSWPVIQEILSSVPYETHLINNKGLLVASSSKDHIFLQDFSALQSVKNMLSGKEGSVDEQSIGDNFLSLTSYVAEDGYLSYSGNGWGLIMTTPITIVNATANNLSRVIILIFAFFMLFFTGVLIAAIYYSVIRPVNRLTQTAMEIAGGNMSVRADVHSRDEIGMLARNFNSMTDGLTRASKYVKGIIKTMPTAVVVMNKEGKITSVNDVTSRLLGYTEAELIGKSIESFFTTTTTTTTTVELLKRLGLEDLGKNKRVDDVRAFLKDKKGTAIPIALSASLLLDDKEGIANIIFAAKDLRELGDYARRRLAAITPILQKVATGDFSQTVDVSKEEDEFSEHLVALNLMIEDFKKMVEEVQKKQEELEAQNAELETATAELEEAKTGLEEKVRERTRELQEAKLGLEKQVQERTKQLQELNANLERTVAERTTELQKKLLELERFNKIAVGRELKMVELKEEVARLQNKPGEKT